MSKTLIWSLSNKQRKFLEDMVIGHIQMLNMIGLTNDVKKVLKKNMYNREQRDKLNKFVRSYKKSNSKYSK